MHIERLEKRSLLSASTSPATVSTVGDEVSLAVSSTTINFGDPITITATVTTRSIDFSTTPIQTKVVPVAGTLVTFFTGSPDHETAITDSNGVAVLTTRRLYTGDQTVNAGIDFQFGEYRFSDKTITVHVTPPAHSTVLSLYNGLSANDFYLPGEPFQLTAQVHPLDFGDLQPTGGDIVFTDGGVYLGTAALQPDGTATIVAANSELSSFQFYQYHSLQAFYSGSAPFANSESNLITAHVVINPTVTSTVHLSTQSKTINQPVTISATVTAGPNPRSGYVSTDDLTGEVSFYDGEQILGTAELQDGTASLDNLSFTPGSHPITATYAGTLLFASSTSSSAATMDVLAHALTPTIRQTNLPKKATPKALSQAYVDISIQNNLPEKNRVYKGSVSIDLMIQVGQQTPLPVHITKTIKFARGRSTTVRIHLPHSPIRSKTESVSIAATVTDAAGDIETSFRTLGS